MPSWIPTLPLWALALLAWGTVLLLGLCLFIGAKRFDKRDDDDK